MVLRFYFLQHHYKTPLDFSLDGIVAAEKAYRKITRALGVHEVGDESMVRNATEERIVADMLAALCDDLNATKMIGILFEHLSEIASSPSLGQLVKVFLRYVTGLACEPLPEAEVTMTEQVAELVKQREAARLAKDWARADEIREQLRELGFDTQDKKS